MTPSMTTVLQWLSLINVESMFVDRFYLTRSCVDIEACCHCRLCVGTGRTLTSHRTPLDYDVIHPSSCPAIQSARDTRLALTGQILEATESGLRLNLASKAEIDKFFQDVVGVLTKLDQLQMLISRLLSMCISGTSICH